MSETEEELFELIEIRSHEAGEGDTGPPSNPEEGSPPPGNGEVPDQPLEATHVTAGLAGRFPQAKTPPKSQGSNRSAVRGAAFLRLPRCNQTARSRQQEEVRDHGPRRGLAGNGRMEGEEKPSCRAREPEGENGGVQVLTEELNRRGLANVWGLIGVPGHLARIMIDSGNLVGDVVSEEFACQANLGGES